MRVVILSLFFITGGFLNSAAIDSKRLLFTRIEGIEDPRIRSIFKLPDSRIAFATESGVEIYNGASFSHLYSVTGDSYHLGGYDGYHHLYVTHNCRYLWIKNRYKLQCIDLDTELYVTDISKLLETLFKTDRADNIFGDTSGNLWIVDSDRLLQPDMNLLIALDIKKGDLLDLSRIGSRLYLFYRSGTVDCIDLNTKETIYSLRAYPEEDQSKFDHTSLVVESPRGFYQIRNGETGGLFLFNTETQTCNTLLVSTLRLNTLAVTDTCLLISAENGFLTIDPRSGKTEHLPILRTKSGNILASELSSIAAEENGEIWIGTLNRGIFYYNPDRYNYFTLHKIDKSGNLISGISSDFSEGHDGSIRIKSNGKYTKIIIPETPDDTIEIAEDEPIINQPAGEYGSAASFITSKGVIIFSEEDFYSIFTPNTSIPESQIIPPLISGIRINAEKIEPLKSYGGRVLLNEIPSRSTSIRLNHDQNFITFEVTDPDISIPNPTFYYMLEGIDGEWRESATADITQRMLHTTYTAVPPGKYRFRIRLSDSTDAPESSIEIIVEHPWWDTTPAWIIYITAALLTICCVIRLYLKRTKKRLEAEQKETMLLSRIRQLIEEVDRYKSESPATEDNPVSSNPDRSALLSEEDKRFVTHAMETVEKNLDTPGYSVANLSRDLCMDRTGLYRKLTTLLDQSPSLFIRDIRLRKAASLIEEGQYSITEIAEKTGFSTTSYMSKCFQERFGCRPSEYRK